MKPRFFPSPSVWHAWLEEHHEEHDELWVGFHKKDSGRPSITWPEAVDGALCFGWIDGIRKSLGETSYVIRFTPRRPRSVWSAVNIKRVAELTQLGRMRPAGVQAFEKRTGNRSEIYAYEQRKGVKLGGVHEKTFRVNKDALGILSSAAALVSAHHKLVGDQRQEGRDATETPRATHQRLRRGKNHTRAAASAGQEVRSSSCRSCVASGVERMWLSVHLEHLAQDPSRLNVGASVPLVLPGQRPR